jgi:hypothetical protein
MSNLNDDLDKLAPKRSVDFCPITRLVSIVEENDGHETALKVLSIIESDMYSTVKVSQVIRNNGYSISKDSIYRHKHRGTTVGCKCKP